MRSDVTQAIIDGRKWIVSRFHHNILSEKLIGNIIHREASIRDENPAVLKRIMAKRKRQMKVEVKAKQAEEYPKLTVSGS